MCFHLDAPFPPAMAARACHLGTLLRRRRALAPPRPRARAAPRAAAARAGVAAGATGVQAAPGDGGPTLRTVVPCPGCGSDIKLSKVREGKEGLGGRRRAGRNRERWRRRRAVAHRAAHWARSAPSTPRRLSLRRGGARGRTAPCVRLWASAELRSAGGRRAPAHPCGLSVVRACCALLCLALRCAALRCAALRCAALATRVSGVADSLCPSTT